MAAVTLSRGCRIFHCAPWRQSSVSYLCSVAAISRSAAALDVDTSRESEVVTVGVGQNYVRKSDASPPNAETKEKRVQVKLRVLQRGEHGIHDDLIPPSTWRVLHNLDRAGYKTYLVGGSVRDLLLHQIPKDFDVLSTASPKQVKGTFPGRGFIVGRRFPICHVHSLGTIVEVSSFSTKLIVKQDKQKSKKVNGVVSHIDGTEGWDERDFARWENSSKRDFTVNGLIYDPFKRLLYDYVGGLKDLQKLKFTGSKI